MSTVWSQYFKLNIDFFYCKNIIPYGIKGDKINQENQKILESVNQSIIKFRSVYFLWSKKNKINYNQLLVLYALRDYPYCTQKQICDNYLLPRQTINHTFEILKKNKIICINNKLNSKKEKAFVLTSYGKRYAEKIFFSLNKMEDQLIEKMGLNKIKQMVKLMEEYDQILFNSFKECEE